VATDRNQRRQERGKEQGQPNHLDRALLVKLEDSTYIWLCGLTCVSDMTDYSGFHDRILCVLSAENVHPIECCWCWKCHDRIYTPTRCIWHDWSCPPTRAPWEYEDGPPPF
jgi:hypothetical protein